LHTFSRLETKLSSLLHDILGSLMYICEASIQIVDMILEILIWGSSLEKGDMERNHKLHRIVLQSSLSVITTCIVKEILGG
jgi:hypothetical protein